MEDKEVLLTQEGYDKLEKELDELKTTKRAEIADRIKIALGYGDLSENSEYNKNQITAEFFMGKTLKKLQTRIDKILT